MVTLLLRSASKCSVLVLADESTGVRQNARLVPSPSGSVMHCTCGCPAVSLRLKLTDEVSSEHLAANILQRATALDTSPALPSSSPLHKQRIFSLWNLPFDIQPPPNQRHIASFRRASLAPYSDSPVISTKTSLSLRSTDPREPHSIRHG